MSDTSKELTIGELLEDDEESEKKFHALIEDYAQDSWKALREIRKSYYSGDLTEGQRATVAIVMFSSWLTILRAVEDTKYKALEEMYREMMQPFVGNYAEFANQLVQTADYRIRPYREKYFPQIQELVDKAKARKEKKK